LLSRIKRTISLGLSARSGDAKFIELAAETIFARSIVAQPAAQPDGVGGVAIVFFEESSRDFGARRRRFAFTFEPAIDVLLYLDGGICVFSGEEHDGDMMPAGIAKGRSAESKAAAVISAQNADGSFGRITVPTDVDGMRTEFAAIGAPGHHGVGAGEKNVLGHFDPKGIV